MKSYTNIEQSKKLAEILPMNSADGYWFKGFPCQPYMVYTKGTPNPGEHILCWSLSALLDVLESEIDGEEGETYQLNIEKDGTQWHVWYRERYDEASPIVVESTEELVYACYELIIKLKERNLL